jgi:HPt (histidine-containing phosphotransfer) domain-containing protein
MTPEVIIDWNELIERMNSEAAAKQLLALFIKQLPESQTHINQHVATGNLSQLDAALHRLLGACSYAGTPKLRVVVAEFNGVVRCMSAADPVLLNEYLNEFNEQVDAVMVEYSR